MAKTESKRAGCNFFFEFVSNTFYGSVADVHGRLEEIDKLVVVMIRVTHEELTISLTRLIL